MVTFLDFKEAANECSIIYLKRQQFVVKLHKQIKEKRMTWGKEVEVNVYEDYLKNNKLQL